MLEQAEEYMGEDFIRAVADEHLPRRYAVVSGNGVLETVGVGVRIESQAVPAFRQQDLLHPG